MSDGDRPRLPGQGGPGLAEGKPGDLCRVPQIITATVLSEREELIALECDGGGSRLSFVSHTVIQARRAARLRDTFGLNIPRHGPGPHLSGPHEAAGAMA